MSLTSHLWQTVLSYLIIVYFHIFQEETTIHPLWTGRWYVERPEVTSSEH